MRRWKIIFHANRKQKKAGVAILILDKIDLKIKKILRDKEGHYIIIKQSVPEEVSVSIYAPNIDSDAGRDWRREEKGTTEDEMAG